MMDRWLNNNTFVKILSVIIALMLWVVANSDRSQTYFPGVGGPANVSTQKSQMTLNARYNDRKYIVKIPTSVQVEVKGSSDQMALFSLLSSRASVFVDLNGYDSGTYTVPVQWEGFPSALQVHVEPSSVSVTIEKMKKIKRTVQVSVVGEAKDGYMAGQPTVSPREAWITVPESQEKNVAMIQAVVSIQDADDNVDSHVPLRVLDRYGQPIEARILPDMVNVTVPLSTTAKAVPVKVMQKGNPPNGYTVQSIRINPPQVRIFGPPDVLKNTTYYPAPEIDVSGMTENKTLQVNLPDVPNITKVDPQKVEVTIEVTAPQTGVKTTTQYVKIITKEVPIQVTGLADGMGSEFVSPASGRITVEIQGDEKQIAQLGESEFRATVDASNLLPGEHTVEVHLNVPPEVKVVNESNLKAVIRIKMK